ncbi:MULTISPECIES: restriction endonuclease [Nocardia]|uniref:restriction endonuclease n=1 Tax=Nocardia TaxID=1817 RepID=UPI002455D8A8|nr:MULTISPECIES: restriction endonuclease [Nocardia]
MTGRDRRCKLCNSQAAHGVFTNVFSASTKQTVRRYNELNPGLGDWYLNNRRHLRDKFKKMQSTTLDNEYDPIWQDDSAPDPRDEDDRSPRAAKMHEIRIALGIKASQAVDAIIDHAHRRIAFARSFIDAEANQPAFTWQEMETLAKQYMILNGHPDARTTPPGPDSGIDVESETAVAQVKHTQARVGRPDIQRLYGVARSKEKVAMFFCVGGFTAEAETWARQYGVELHIFDHLTARFR